jgi:hypothetical protein
MELLEKLIIIAFNGDVHPRIKAPFPFQNILSRPWSVKISLTDGTSCWIHPKEPEKRSEGKKCKPGEARERQNDGR